MKPIKFNRHNTPVHVKWMVILVALIISISFALSVKYSGENKKEYAELKFNNKILSPACSVNGGYYDHPIAVSLNPSAGEVIYYTIDGSVPGLNSMLYHKPIIIEQNENPAVYAMIPSSARWFPPLGEVYRATVLRAISVNGDNEKSNELVRTFFVDETGSHHYKIPVFELTVDPDDFFDRKKGIYVLGKEYEDKRNYIRKKMPSNLNWWEYPSNYLKRGDDSERPAHVEFFEQDGSLAFETNAGVRINGNATRGFSQKALRISFDSKYGSGALKYKMFLDNKVDIFNALLLRNGGNDWDKTMFRDGFMQDLVKNEHLDIQSYRPCVVFINGEYWGLHNIREREDENYLVNKYRISKDSLVMLELGGNVAFGKKNDADDFKELLTFMSTADMAKDAAFERVKDKIDLLSFMDFIIANVYFCNRDWPNNNVRFWRFKGAQSSDSAGVRDGRYRWMLYDTDWGFGYTGNDAVSMNLLERAEKTGSVGVLFRGLLKNSHFREEFYERFKNDLNTIFKPENVLKKINEFENAIEPYMTEHINRWRVIDNYSTWKSNVQQLREFAVKRPAIQLQQLEDFLKKKEIK